MTYLIALRSSPRLLPYSSLLLLLTARRWWLRRRGKRRELITNLTLDPLLWNERWIQSHDWLIYLLISLLILSPLVPWKRRDKIIEEEILIYWKWNFNEKVKFPDYRRSSVIDKLISCLFLSFTENSCSRKGLSPYLSSLLLLLVQSFGNKREKKG